eukprot:7940439-Pyramimonas_sp.AAC.1
MPGSLIGAPSRVWPTLDRNIPRPSTNRSPSTGIHRTRRPIAVPQQEYTSHINQSQSLNRNIPHPSTNPGRTLGSVSKAAISGARPVAVEVYIL